MKKYMRKDDLYLEKNLNKFKEEYGIVDEESNFLRIKNDYKQKLSDLNFLNAMELDAVSSFNSYNNKEMLVKRNPKNFEHHNSHHHNDRRRDNNHSDRNSDYKKNHQDHPYKYNNGVGNGYAYKNKREKGGNPYNDYIPAGTPYQGSIHNNRNNSPPRNNDWRFKKNNNSKRSK
jgi:hypothetical protein